VWFCLCDPTFSRFCRTPISDRHRQINRRTQGRSIYRASVPSRDKDASVFIADKASFTLYADRRVARVSVFYVVHNVLKRMN